MPTNTRGGFAPLRIPGVGLLPVSVQGPANEYNVAVTRLQEAETRRDTLTHPNALEAAKQRDIAALKTSGKAGQHKHVQRHAQDVRDVEQECTAFQQLAVDREAELINAARNAERPEPSDLTREHEAVNALAGVFAQSRIAADVTRWMDAPERPFTTAVASALEKALKALRDELDGLRPKPGFFDLSSAVDVSPLDPAQNPSMGAPRPRAPHANIGPEIELPGGQRVAVGAVAEFDPAAPVGNLS